MINVEDHAAHCRMAREIIISHTMYMYLSSDAPRGILDSDAWVGRKQATTRMNQVPDF